MQEHFAPALRVALVTLVLTGLAYPLAVTGLARLLFPAEASGSFATEARGQVVGSELIGQGFSSAAYFQPRPSSAGEHGWDARGSSGSNLGTTSAQLRERLGKEAAKLAAANPDAPGPIPPELVLASGSGLDPHVSPEAALWQVPRVARARGLAPERLRAVVAAAVEERTFGFLGEPRVNVLKLNLALDRQFGRPRPGAADAASR